MNTAVQRFQTRLPRKNPNVHLMIARLQRRGSVVPLLEEHKGTKSDFNAPSPIGGDARLVFDFPKKDFGSKPAAAVKSEEDVDFFQVMSLRKQSSVRQKSKKPKKKGSITPMPATKTPVLEDDTTVDTHVSASSMAQQDSGIPLKPTTIKFNRKLSNQVEMEADVGARMGFFASKADMAKKPSLTNSSHSRGSTVNNRSVHDNRRLLLEEKEVTPQKDSSHVVRGGNQGGICVLCNNLDKAEETKNTSYSATSSPSVRFGRVEVRKYPVVLGDTACSSGGPALTIGWKHTSRVSTCVCCLERRRAKAAKRSFRLTREGREKRLIYHGYTELELAVASSRTDNKNNSKLT